MTASLAHFDFNALVAAIRRAHEQMAAQAGKAINITLTMRNWRDIEVRDEGYDHKGFRKGI